MIIFNEISTMFFNNKILLYSPLHFAIENENTKIVDTLLPLIGNEIQPGFFTAFKALKSIVIPSCVKLIGNEAFRGCSLL